MPSARNLSNKYGKSLLNTARGRRLDPTKIASKTIVRKTAEATWELIGHKIAEKIVDKIAVLPEKRQEIFSELRQVQNNRVHSTPHNFKTFK